MNDLPILECRDVFRSFNVSDKKIEVLKGVNLSVRTGETVVIKGRSGEGKSVLLWILSGLDKASSGRVIIDGQSINDCSNSELAELRRTKMGIIFQNFNLVSSWTAYENVESALIHSVNAKDRRRKILDILEELGLSHRMGNFPNQLSVGQQQRVAIARTLATEPMLILADEPTGDVDPETASDILKMLLSPVQQRGATLVVATHGTFPLDVADRVFALKDGVIT